MATLFTLIFLASLVCLIVGLVKPSSLKLKSRGQVSLWFGGAMVASLILVGIVSPSPAPANTTPAVTPTPQVTENSASSSPVVSATSTPTNDAPNQTPTVAPISNGRKSNQQTSAANAPVQSQPATVNPTPPATPTPSAPTQQTLLSISGEGTKSTQEFTAVGDWQMSYTYDCSNADNRGNFQVYIDNSDGSGADMVGPNELGASGADTDYYHEGGTYYLEINSECAWTVKITATQSASVAQPPQPSRQQTLLSTSGEGTKSTQTFTANSDWELNYNYDCSNAGGKGNFQVYIDNGDGSSAEMVGPNELGSSGSGVDYYHQGGAYYLEVNSECSWNIQVRG